jgi:WD40 repeat protein
MYLIGIRDNRIDIWAYHSAELAATLSSNCHYFPSLYGCSTDGSLLAICSGDGTKVTIWDLTVMDDCKELHQLSPLPRGHINSICFVKNGEQLIIGYGSHVVAVYDARSGMTMHVAEMPACAEVFSRGVGESIITVSFCGAIQELDTDLACLREYHIDVSEFCSPVVLLGDSLVWSPASTSIS